MKKRRQDIDHIFRSKKYDHIKTFVSLECDIMPSGELALPDDAIEYVDYLVVSIHSSFRQDRKTMTDRVLKALSKPKVKIFGHPTGRLLGKREGIELDWDKIFVLVKEKNIAFEVNSWPERLDLPDILVREAVEQGIKLVINTDAHAVSQMDGMEYGVAVARRGWASKHDIMNTLPYNEFKKWILERR
jgi:DNA polymerase (family 10)